MKCRNARALFRGCIAFGLAGAAPLLAATATAAPSLPYAYAMRGCTQEDAPALEIYLFDAPLGESAPRPPYLRIEIASRGEGPPPARYTLSPLRRDPASRQRLARAEWVEKGRPPQWLSGTLAIAEVGPDHAVAGKFSFSLPNGRRRTGRFSAKRIGEKAMCG